MSLYTEEIAQVIVESTDRVIDAMNKNITIYIYFIGSEQNEVELMVKVLKITCIPYDKEKEFIQLNSLRFINSLSDKNFEFYGIVDNETIINIRKYTSSSLDTKIDILDTKIDKLSNKLDCIGKSVDQLVKDLGMVYEPTIRFRIGQDYDKTFVQPIESNDLLGLLRLAIPKNCIENVDDKIIDELYTGMFNKHQHGVTRMRLQVIGENISKRLSNYVDRNDIIKTQYPFVNDIINKNANADYQKLAENPILGFSLLQDFVIVNDKQDILQTIQQCNSAEYNVSKLMSYIKLNSKSFEVDLRGSNSIKIIKKSYTDNDNKLKNNYTFVYELTVGEVKVGQTKDLVMKGCVQLALHAFRSMWLAYFLYDKWQSTTNKITKTYFYADIVGLYIYPSERLGVDDENFHGPDCFCNDKCTNVPDEIEIYTNILMEKLNKPPGEIKFKIKNKKYTF